MALPGGYTVGEKVFYTGANWTASNGDKLVLGQQGEVTGPATLETHKGKGVAVRFPGNTGIVECYLTTVNAASKVGAREAAARATWAEPGTHKPTLTREGTMALKRWHFFLSHTQRNGDAKSIALELFFGFSEQGKKIWLDVKMPKMDMEAMKDGVNGSRCVLAIITGGDDTESRYFQRPMCVEELKWAIEAGVKIVPVVTAADKPKVGEYIAEGIAAGIDLSACDFQHIDRSNPIMIEASLKSIIGAEEIAEAGKAKVVAGSALANAGSSVQGLAELLASLKLTEHLGAADAWCVDEVGASDVADLKDEDLAEQLAEVLGLKKIPAKKLVAAIRG